MTCGVGPDVAPDLGAGAERQDAIPADRDRLRLRPAVVHGDDLAVRQDEIGGRRLRRGRGAAAVRTARAVRTMTATAERDEDQGLAGHLSSYAGPRQRR